MKIVIAPDSFKGSLTSPEVCRAIEAGVLAALPDAQTVLVPIADGGDGTARTLVAGTGGELLSVTVTGPLGDPVDAEYGVLGDGVTAVIEMATASGLTLVPLERRNPLVTTTRGTGELIAAALGRGCRQLIVGIGGSATNDGGLGMAQALGVRCLDEAGEDVPGTGEGLGRLAAVDVSGLDLRLRQAAIRVACDVDNPLFGERGAAHVYGPQKGATPEVVAQLDAGLRRFAAVVERDLGVSVADLPGAGAAGGLGAGLVAFCGATLEPGTGIVLDAVGLEEKLRGAEVVFTGEGRIDFQTAFGKAPAGVAQRARKHGCVVLALGGIVALDARSLHDHGFAALGSIVNAPMSLEDAMQPQRAFALTAFAAEEMLRTYVAGRSLTPRPPLLNGEGAGGEVTRSENSGYRVKGAASAGTVRFARQQRREATPTEDALWQALRKRALGVRFRRQHGIEGFVLDFYCEQAALAIEVDGAHHRERREYDEWRTECLARYGIRVERVRVGDVETDLRGVVRRIAGWIAEQLGEASPPDPLS